MSFLSRAEELIRFINASRSPYHAVASAKKILQQVGFVELHENSRWNLQHGGLYFYTRNQSSLVAFAVGAKFVPGNGFSILASHTDSPCLKVKPISNVGGQGYHQVGVSTYGGGLWHTWFDRDLTVAGRVILSNPSGFSSELVTIDRPILRIPSLAIHLDRTVDEHFKFNKETHLKPILESALKTAFETKPEDPHNNSLLNLLATTLNVKKEDIINFDLSLCDLQPATIGGINNEFIFSPRLDNLLHSFTGVTSLAETSTKESLLNEENIRMTLLFDHEEVGSRSVNGAMSPMLNEAYERIHQAFIQGHLSHDLVLISKRKSFLISADMNHAVHPNYPEKHEDKHRPSMNKGPAIKINLETRYATNSETEFIVEQISRKRSIPVQKFCVRNDMPCGTTIGPILAGETGIRTVDIGNPQLSMHSIREICGVDDVLHCINLCKAFLEEFSTLDKSVKID